MATTKPLLTGLKRRNSIFEDIFNRTVGVSLIEFGADPTGLTSSTDAFIAAFTFASDNDLKVIQHGGTYKLDGGKVIQFSCEVDLSGSTLLIDGWQGEFRFSQKQTPTTYNASNESTYGVLAMFNSSDGDSRSVGSSYLSGLAGSELLNNHYVIFTTPQQMFQYRDTDGIITRKELNRVYNRGMLEDPFKYGLGNNVNSVYALPIADKETVLKGFCFDIKNATRYRFMQISDSTRIRLEGWSVRNKPVDSTNKDFFPIEKYRCYDVIMSNFDDCYTVTSRETSGSLRSSYCFSATECMNLHYFNCHANGAGWGSVGNNDCSRVTYERCKLSRIDFHLPYRTYLKVLDCDLGRDGVVVSGYGDLQIERTRFGFLTEINGAGFIDGNVVSTRPDAGGFVDGDLVIKDVALYGRFNSFAPQKGLINGVSDANRGPVTGSPVKRTLFNNVLIDNLNHASQSGNSHFSYLISCNRTDAVQFPRTLTVRNTDMRCAKSSGLGVQINMASFAANQDSSLSNEPAMSVRYTTTINLDKVDTTHVTIFGSSNKHNPRVLLRDCGNSNFQETAMLCTFAQRGLYELDGCEVEGFNFLSGSPANGAVQVQMRGGRLLTSSGDNAPIKNVIGTAVGSSVTLSGTDVVGDFGVSPYDLGKNLAQHCSFKGCRVFNRSGVRVLGIQLYSGSTTNATFSPTIPVKYGSKLLLANGFTGNNTYTVNECLVPLSAAKAYTYLGGSNGAIATFGVGASGASSADLSSVTSPAGLELVAIYVSAQ